MSAVLRVIDQAPEAQSRQAAPSVDVWVSCLDLAKLGRLPGLPQAKTELSRKRKLNDLAARERWDVKVAPDGTALARTRKGRGGGVEYHVDVLPPAARAKVLEALAPCHIESDLPEAANDTRSQIWSWFEIQNEATQTKARRNLAVVDAVKSAIAAGHTRAAAVASACAHFGVSAASVGNWLKAVRGIPRCDWLPHLAPRNRGGGKAADVDYALWMELLSDYLRPGSVTWESCYWRASRKAAERGVTLPTSRTLFRKMEREIDPLVRITVEYRTRLSDLEAKLKQVADTVSSGEKGGTKETLAKITSLLTTGA